MDADETDMAFHDWQQRLALIASEMEAMADANNFHALYDPMGLVTDAMARLDEIKP